MAQDAVIRTVSEFCETILQREFLLGLEGKPVSPWYLGQPDDTTSILPTYYRSKLDPTLEREILRDFKSQIGEVSPVRGLYDEDVLLMAHGFTVPTRIVDWTGNALVALFTACETMNEAKPGRVWAFNPWAFNDATMKLAYVPMTDSEYFKRYVVALTKPEAPQTPEPELPLAVRPTRATRIANFANLHYTIHGSAKDPIDQLKLFGRKRESYLRPMLIDPARKKSIMRELFTLGITRFNITPGGPALARTLAYRYSNDYLNAIP